jgi:hypothetical protein
MAKWANFCSYLGDEKHNECFRLKLPSFLKKKKFKYKGLLLNAI